MSHRPPSREPVLGLVALTGVFLLSSIAAAETTTGGVNWLDSLGYTKPAFYPLTVPDEAGVANKYYVDLSSGSGSTCSQSSPCGSLNAVSGKPGMNGGPAYVYLKGNGYLNLTGGTLAGSAGNEIVVKPWPGDSTPAVMTAAGGCNVANANTIAGSGVHHIVFDGGPDMLFRFRGSGCTSDQNGYTLVVKSNNITLYRVRIDARGSGGPALGPGTGSGTHTSNFRFINSELYGATRYYGVYTGGGTGCTARDTSHTDIEFRNSIFRQIDGRGIQIEPRSNSNGVIIDGNVFHDIGYNRSGTSSISGAVQVANACGGTTSGIVVSNNLMWDLGGGGVLVFQNVGSDSAFKIINNTIFEYAGKSPVSLNSHGITCYSDGCNAEVRNNIILSPQNGGVNALNRDSSFAKSDNLTSGLGSSVFVSTSTSSPSFLYPEDSAIGGGSAQSGIDTDYLGTSRPTSGTTDLGAIMLTDPPAVSKPPTDLQAD